MLTGAYGLRRRQQICSFWVRAVSRREEFEILVGVDRENNSEGNLEPGPVGIDLGAMCPQGVSRLLDVWPDVDKGERRIKRIGPDVFDPTAERRFQTARRHRLAKCVQPPDREYRRVETIRRPRSAGIGESIRVSSRIEDSLGKVVNP